KSDQPAFPHFCAAFDAGIEKVIFQNTSSSPSSVCEPVIPAIAPANTQGGQHSARVVAGAQPSGFIKAVVRQIHPELTTKGQFVRNKGLPHRYGSGAKTG